MSPFDALPNAESRPPSKSFKARITEVQKDSTGENYSFLFTVQPLAQYVDTGTADKTIKDVSITVPGLGSLDDIANPPTGLIYFPEVGSIVRIEPDGSRYTITGFYTGPVRTSLESGSDPEGRRMSYNPGIEIDHHRNTGFPGWDLPHWSFGLKPGDVIMGKKQSRVKITGEGVVIGGDLDCLSIYKTDGGRIDRWAEMEVKGVGYWSNHRYGRGTAELAAAANVAKDPKAFPPPRDAWVSRTDIYEVAPEMRALRPYLMEQRGYLSRLNTDDGRSQIQTAAPLGRVQAELEALDYVIARRVVAHPIVPEVPSIAGELKSRAFTTQDEQHDADGSFRHRHGNLGKLPGAQDQAETGQLDLSVEYDNSANVYHIRIGRAGANGARITVRGNVETDSAIEVECFDLKATVRNKLEATAKNAEVTVEQKTKLTTNDAEVQVGNELKANVGSKTVLVCPDITLDGPVKITKTLQVQQGLSVQGNSTLTGDVTAKSNVNATGDVKAGAISLRTHVHQYTWTDPGGAGATQPPQ
jgi:hypothetical protein